MDPTRDVVFREFRPWQGFVPAGYDANLLGQLTDGSFHTNRFVATGYPLNEEIFELRLLLEAVLEAKDSFTMVECGAGYGRWLVGAACAIKARRPGLPFFLVGIEPDSDHFRWLHKNFADNGLDPSEHRLVLGAVADADGEDIFLTNDDPAGWWGQHLAYAEHHRTNLTDGYRRQLVRTYSIAGILKDLTTVDLMDFDIQYAEERAIAPAIDDMTRKVKRVFVETHSPDLHKSIYELFASRGWVCVAKYGFVKPYVQNADYVSEERTPFGMVRFQAGLQCWINRSLMNRGITDAPSRLPRRLRRLLGFGDP